MIHCLLAIKNAQYSLQQSKDNKKLDVDTNETSSEGVMDKPIWPISKIFDYFESRNK